MPDPMEFQGNDTYAQPYAAAMRRVQGGYVNRKANLAQDLAMRGVSTSGVSAIPEGVLSGQQGTDEAGVAEQFGLAQAGAAQREREMALGNSYDMAKQERDQQFQSALQRRMAQGQLNAALIGGGIGAIGAAGGGYFQGLAGKP